MTSYQPAIPNKHHLSGVDLLRVIAIISVIVLHTDEGFSNLPIIWNGIATFSGFAVPFFLATSFFFCAKNLYKNKGQFSWKKRLPKLIIPYLFWSLIYLSYRTLKYTISQQPERVLNQFQDPLALVFFGSTTLHLYFLPLLITGTVLLGLVGAFVVRQQFSIWKIAICSSISLLGYEALLLSGNGFYHSENDAFKATRSYLKLGDFSIIERLSAVMLAWVIECLPYIFIALILARISSIAWSKGSAKLITIISAVLVLFFGHLFLPPGIHEISRGYLALLFALSISPIVPSTKLLKYLGSCVFGVYLVHLFFVEIYQSLVQLIMPHLFSNPSTIFLILSTVSIYIFSMVAVDILRKQKSIELLKIL